MSFRENLVKARSHIVFLVALGCGLALVIALEGRLESTAKPAVTGPEPMQQAAAASPLAAFDDVEPLPLTQPSVPSANDLNHARIAWRYFENNTNDTTGLVNSAHGYPSTTMWETGSYLIAVRSAHILGLIDQAEAQSRVEQVLDTLAAIRLFDDILPNKAYNVQTGELVDYSNKPVERGLGWSALDIARVVCAFGIVERHYPELTQQVAKVMDHWSLSHMVGDGHLVGGNIAGEDLRRDQEGRVGYEQYAAKAMMLYGFDTFNAYKVDDNLMVKEVNGHPIPVDQRLHRNTTPAFVVSEPYLFDGLEFGFDSRSQRFASAIYGAQEARWVETGTLTALTESHLNEAPYFIYSTIWGGGTEWSVMSFTGDRLDSKRTVATKAAFAWDALFGTEYTQKLVEAVSPLGDPEKGFPEGIFEVDGSINSSTTTNTNAVVLAALAFKRAGPLLQVPKK